MLTSTFPGPAGRDQFSEALLASDFQRRLQQLGFSR